MRMIVMKSKSYYPSFVLLFLLGMLLPHSIFVFAGLKSGVLIGLGSGTAGFAASKYYRADCTE